jgi:hypothetical protein
MRGLLERDSEQLARFHREAEVIEDLRHPNVVQMFDYAIVDESPYLVMEYIPGPSLAAYLKKLHDKQQRLPIGVVAQILKSIASALDYAHMKGLVHRDIKPANVLLRSQTGPVELDKPLPEDVEPILTDFGLVRLLDSTMLTTAGSVSGTPTYMSPEQARGEKVDKRTDIYSLGIMLYEMLAGTVPFQSDTTFGMLMKQINEPPPPIKGISPDLQALLDRALAKNPALRYESAGELADEFMALFNGQTISPGTLHIAEMARQAAEASQQAKKQPEERPSRRWLRIGLEIAAVLILAFIIYQLVDSNRVTAIAPNVPVGRMRYSYGTTDFDKITFSLTQATPPEENEHLEAWLLYDNGTFRDVGTIFFDTSSVGRLDYTDPNGNNLLDGVREIQITREPNDVSSATPTGEVVYSSVFPPQALVHIRNLGVSFDGGTDQAALLPGLYYYSGSYIETAISGDPDFPSYIPIVTAFENGDAATLRKRTEELINMIVGSESEQYSDHDGDGQIDTQANGYGSLPNGNQAGYLRQTALEAQGAADAPDATSNIRQQNANLQVCINNMTNWINQILPLALQLQEMSFGPEMKPVIDELVFLGKALSNGVDANNSGPIEPREGECGALSAYDYGTYMADFSIFVGSNRIPPTPENE